MSMSIILILTLISVLVFVGVQNGRMQFVIGIKGSNQFFFVMQLKG